MTFNESKMALPLFSLRRIKESRSSIGAFEVISE
jgi:hypothetical protein